MFEFLTSLFTPVLILFGFTAPAPEPIPTEPVPIIEQAQETVVTPTSTPATSTSVELGTSVIPKPQPIAQTPPVVTIAQEPATVTEEPMSEITESYTPSEVPIKPLATPSTTTIEETVPEPVCGDMHKETLSSVPANNLCAVGEVTNGDLDESIYSWQCISEDVETDCKAFVTTHGVCGVSSDVLLPNSYNKDVLCSAGTLTDKQSSFGELSWICEGFYDGYDAACSAKLANAGSCGSAQGKTFSTFPTTNLCKLGEVTNQTEDDHHFMWNCTGVNDGNDARCAALIKVSETNNSTTEIDPSCIPTSGGILLPPIGCSQ